MDDVRYEHHLKHRGRTNRRVAAIFWLAIGVVVFGLYVQRTVRWWQKRNRRGGVQQRQTLCSTWLKRRKALIRGVSQRATPLCDISIGRFLALTAYASIIVAILLSVNAPKFTLHFEDDVAFRAAWATLSQIPLVYLLSTKRGPLNYLTGLSYERLNWLHKCVGRMIFVSATTHMAIMLSSISFSDLVRSSEEGMGVVRYGAGAYTILAWIAVSSIMGARKRWYRVFYINHWVSTIVFLAMAFKHVPSYGRLPIYTSIVLLATDKSLVVFGYLYNNMSIRSMKGEFDRYQSRSSGDGEIHALAMGHPVKMVAPIVTGGTIEARESTTVIRIVDLPFKWKPGQHIRMWLPRLGALGVHPFTPATSSDISLQRATESGDAEEDGLLPADPETTQPNDMVLMIKAHTGLTKRLAEYRNEWRSLPCPNASRPSSSLVAFLDGPYGKAPAWEEYENLVLMSTSTGVSLSLSILNYLDQLYFADDTQIQTRQIRFIWSNRHIEPAFEATVVDLLNKNSASLRYSGVDVRAEFYITCPSSREQSTDPGNTTIDPFAHLRRPRRRYLLGKPPLRIRNPNDPYAWDSDGESIHTFRNSSIESSDMESQSSEDTYVEDRPEEQRPCLSDLYLTTVESDASWWTRFKLSRWGKKTKSSQESCHCALSRYQERKYNPVRLPPFITRFYDARPNIKEILSASVPRSGLSKSMVTVCGRKIENDVRRTVSKMNVDFSMGGRKLGVDLHVEGFS